jgi:tetratricopeptide (TPR) repeat protein
VPYNLDQAISEKEIELKGRPKSIATQNLAIPTGIILPPKYDSLEEQFEFAKLEMKNAQGASSSNKWRQLKRSAGAWNAVCAYWLSAGPLQAEASYRLGEILLRLDDPGGAFGAFQMTVDLGGGTHFHARARLQIGHIHRRSGQLSHALAAYKKVDDEPSATLRQRNDALEWQGKTLMLMGEWEQAKEALAVWATQAEGPLEVIRATDLQAQAFISAKDALAAEILLSTLRENLRSLSNEATLEGQKVYAALGRLRADQQLRLIRHFGESHSDG